MKNAQIEPPPLVPVREAQMGLQSRDMVTFSTLKRVAIILPIAFLSVLWVLVHTVLSSLHRFPGILIMLGLVTLGVAAFAFGVFAVVGRLERQIVAQNRKLGALLTVGRAASSSLVVGELLDAAIDAILDVLHADGAEVWLLDGEGRLRIARRRGIEDPNAGDWTDGAPDMLLERVAHDAYGSGDDVSERIAAQGFQTYRALPLRHLQQPLGVLGVAWRAPTGLRGEWELGLLEGIGEWMSLAVVNARLHEEVLDGAVLEERLRIARELHDGVAQVLSYINAQTLAVESLLATDRGEDARGELAAMEHATRQVYGDVREAILGLRTSLTRPGLVPALREHLAQYERIADTAPRLVLFDAVEELELPAPVEIQVIRLVQEALANVRKHAGADTVQVRLEIDEGDLHIEIEDDGRGFEPASPTRTGWPRFGLQTMQERAQSLGGRFELDSRLGVGTKVTVTVPLVEDREDQLAGIAR